MRDLPAPHAVTGVGTFSVVLAILPHRTGKADLLALVGRLTLLRKERVYGFWVGSLVGGGVDTGGSFHPGLV